MPVDTKDEEVRSPRVYLSRLFQATLTLVTTVPKRELSAGSRMGLAELWGNGDPRPRLLDERVGLGGT
jgi:hypothetical protein